MQGPPSNRGGVGGFTPVPVHVPGAPTSNPSYSGSGRSGPGFQGAHVGRYELLLELAAGGMGSVYVGRQRGAAGFERLVAIKRMHPHLARDAELTLAFHEEARIASLIRHPNAVNVVDVYEEQNEHLLVMEYIEGVAVSSLSSAARRQAVRIARPVALRVAIDALRGLHAAHELIGLDGRPLQVVHRDVSPQNILVASDGTVRLTDFGIARALQRLVHTATGSLKGKLRYMSPEQALNRPVDRRADVFALAIVLWEMLTGERLYSGETDLEILQAAANGQVQPLSAIDPSIPRDLEAIVMHALAFEPGVRFPTAAAFADALERWCINARESATQGDVAAQVRALVGEVIDGRRRQIQDIVTGRMPISVRSGVNPLVHHGTPTAGPSTLGARNSMAQAPASRLPIYALLAIVALGLGVGGGLYINARFNDKGAKAASPSATSAPSAASADRVRVQVLATGISGIVGPGVSDVQFTADGATFELPRGSEAVDVEIRLSDGTIRHESISPNSNAALRIEPAVSPSATSTAPASSTAEPIASSSAAPATAAPAQTAARPPPPGGARPPPPPPPPGGLRKNPYGN